jgi:hypothetical protein
MIGGGVESAEINYRSRSAHMMPTKKIVSAVVLALVLGLVPVSAVLADGTTTKEVCVTQYGGATECHTETISEEVTHETVQADLGDINVLAVAGIMAGFGIALFGAAKLTARAYFLD